MRLSLCVEYCGSFFRSLVSPTRPHSLSLSRASALLLLHAITSLFRLSTTRFGYKQEQGTNKQLLPKISCDKFDRLLKKTVSSV